MKTCPRGGLLMNASPSAISGIAQIQILTLRYDASRSDYDHVIHRVLIFTALITFWGVYAFLSIGDTRNTPHDHTSHMFSSRIHNMNCCPLYNYSRNPERNHRAVTVKITVGSARANFTLALYHVLLLGFVYDLNSRAVYTNVTLRNILN
jgi:hypothetical protein